MSQQTPVMVIGKTIIDIEKSLLIIAVGVFMLAGWAAIPTIGLSPFPGDSQGRFDAAASAGSPAAAQIPRCAQPEHVVATILDGYIAFVDSTSIQPLAAAWPAAQMKSMERTYGAVIRDGYAGSRGFDSVDAWAQAFGIGRASAVCPGPDCCNAGGALRFMYVPGAISSAGWRHLGDDLLVPAIQTGCGTDDCPYPDLAYHELAHLWDHRLDGALSAELDEAMGVVRKANGRVDVDHYFGRKPAEAYLPAGQPPARRHGDFPSAYFDSADPSQPAGGEHFAETVAAYFLVEQGDRYDYPVCWTDEDPRCPAGTRYEYDRYDFIEELFRLAVKNDGASD